MLIATIKSRRYESGEKIFEENGFAENMYLIYRGKVRLETEHTSLGVDKIREGEYFGVLWNFFRNLPNVSVPQLPKKPQFYTKYHSHTHFKSVCHGCSVISTKREF